MAEELKKEELISQAQKLFNEFSVKIDELTKYAEKKIEDAEAFLSTAKTNTETSTKEIEGKKQSIEKFKTNIETIKNEVDAYHKSFLEIKSHLDSTDNGLEANLSWSKTKREEIDEKYEEAKKIISEKEKFITDFEATLNNKTKPFLEEIERDIQTKRHELNSLLSHATANTLAQSYAESKYEYSIPAPRKGENKGIFKNLGNFIFNNFWRYIGFIFDHVIFILPLVFISLIFINEHVAEIVLKSLSKENEVPGARELIYVKTIISLPLLWIAWYGQRNISQRKRLAEEYNHKLRVTQMYLMFITNESAYTLKDKEALEKTLLEVIGRNPSKVYRSDETMLDKILDLFLRGRKEVDKIIESSGN